MAQPIRVMLVDDTDHVRRMLVTMLDIDGFDVVAEASQGVAAVEAAERVAPDVIVIDYKMPDIDGLETARRIKSARPEQAIILYTAFTDEEVTRSATELDVHLIDKVEGLGTLEREIARVCGRA